MLRLASVATLNICQILMRYPGYSFIFHLFSEQLRNINEASAVYMPYKPVQRFIGHQAEEMERLSSALKKHGIDCGPLQVNISVS